jgi:hypothetical protein
MNGGFRGFSQSLPGNTSKYNVLASSTSFVIYYSLIILPLDSMSSKLLTA